MSIREDVIGFDNTPTLLEMNGERWLGTALMSRERHTTLGLFDGSLTMALTRLDQAHRHMTAYEDKHESARQLAGVRRQLEEAHSQMRRQRLQSDAERMRLEEAAEEAAAEAASKIEELQHEVSELRAAKAATKMHLLNRSHTVNLMAAKSAMAQEEIEAQKLQLEAEKQKNAVVNERSIVARIQANHLELENFRKMQEKEVRVFAATLMQAHARRKKECAECEAARTQERLQDVYRLANVQMEAAQNAVEVERITTKFRDQHMTIRDPIDGSIVTLDQAIRFMIDFELPRLERERGMSETSARYTRELVCGRPEKAALGIVACLNIDLFDLFALCNRGLAAIEEEWMRHGTEEDKECVHYVLHEKAGVCEAAMREFKNGMRDQGRNGEVLEDFVNMEDAVKAQLNIAHVAALRIYTTACFMSINEPLRDESRTEPHPFPTTVFFLSDGIKRLRAVHVDGEPKESKPASPDGCPSPPKPKRTASETFVHGDGERGQLDLWRGMKNVRESGMFSIEGGSQAAPMSTTNSLEVAVAYGQSKNSLLFKIVVKSFMQCGADISFLSAFPGEKEYLFPPLTFLQPTERPPEEIRVKPANGKKGEWYTFRVIEVEPVM